MRTEGDEEVVVSLIERGIPGDSCPLDCRNRDSSSGDTKSKQGK